MLFSIDLRTLISKSLTFNQAVVLWLIYYKKFDEVALLIGKQEAISIRNTLVDTPYLLSDSSVKFRDTIISKKNVEKLFGIRSDKINFWEFYSSYPIKVGTRVLRGASDSSLVSKKHEKKYLDKIKTVEQHEKAILSLEAFVAKQKQSNSMKFLPMMETVMNNCLWETWEVFIDEVGKEGLDWNNDSI
jgi:hypothetical protein